MNFFLGQIGMFGFNFPPRGWALCSGTILPIAQNTALFSLLGTTYGGNGQSTFGLPDLRSRTPMGFGNLTSLGEMAGVENVSLLITEIPLHTHHMNATSQNGDELKEAANSIFAAGDTGPLPGTPQPTYNNGPASTMLNAGTVGIYGQSQPHNNIQPSLAINYCIATTGYFPARN
ncbi:MAG: phage tail protein [Proteobacteria bacterium]|nr:phage tail protein [Pseudomonadota bacterium]